MVTPARIVITPGEPAGIGPDVTIKIAQQSWPVELIVVADPNLLEDRAKQLGLPLTLETLSSPRSLLSLRSSLSSPRRRGPIPAHHENNNEEPDLNMDPRLRGDDREHKEGHSKPGHLKIIPVKLNVPCETGILNPANASYVLECLKIAADHCLQNHAQALVTGPVHKATINQANIAFTGHTEFLADYCNVPQVLMLFVADNMKVALATTHLPLKAVSEAITTDKLLTTLRLFSSELTKKFNIHAPKILVCGLNPHAGENGHLGREEIDTISPALYRLKEEGIDVVGPLPADTLFTKKHLESADAVLAMYHDQALPVVKYAGFGHAVNMTLGLPIVRTSVDHGTAIDIAGTSHVDAESMAAALRLAIHLS